MNKSQLSERLSPQMHRDLWRFVMSRVRNPDLTDEITQEAMISAVRKIDQLRDNEKFKSWLFSIAANKCYELLRKKAKHISQIKNIDHSQLFDYLNPHNTESAEMTAINIMEISSRQAYVDNLPSLARQIFVLRGYDELTFRAIAEMLCININTVKALYYRALDKYDEAEGVDDDEK